MAAGMAAVMSTATTCSTARSLGMLVIREATLSHAITTRAPWSSNWWRSSGVVYRGLCSTTIAPSRSTA